jgi:gliding motility-associated-like protein
VIEDCGEMFVPNAFSPNGDGHNDVLKVNGICLQNLSFMIFNRWGEKVFETIDQETGWDGTYKGEAMNTGVYVYRLEGKTYDGKAFSGKGNITLIR